MQYTKINSYDKEIAKLVLGTLIVTKDNLEKSFSLLDDAFELGYTTLDTARAYPSEEPIGEWMQARKNRDKLVIISKGGHPSMLRKRVTPYDITSDLFESLAALKTDYIDIYLLHRDDTDLPVGPIVEILNEHLKAGRIKAFGGSNWTHERLREANEYAAAHGLVGFIASSPHYSLAEQVEEPWAPGCIAISGPSNERARQWYAETGIPVFAYSSLARGFFSGRISRSRFENNKASIDQACLTAYCYEQNFKRLDRAEILAKEKGIPIPQVALAYIMSQPMTVFPIIGAENRSELESNLDVLDIKLTEKEVAWLDLQSDSR